ncbi:TetR/AcrR family transcriptional regulator, partial [Ferruginivarius sediminum]
TGEERRRQILDTMLRMAGEQGPDAVTTKALAARIGVSEPALYRHFPEGKPQMWRALATVLGERMQTAWRAALGEGDPAPARLRQLVAAQLRLIVTTPALPAILFSRTLHRGNAALRAGVAEVAGRFHARLEHIIADGQRTGKIDPGVEPDAAAWLVISVVQGTAIRWSLSERAFDLEREGLRVLDVALRGLEAGRPAQETVS